MVFHRLPNQQDLSWFIDMHGQGRLKLDPPYQRKSVWTYKDKQEFLDTVLNNYPCPAIYLQKENTPRGPIYNVVDGKQRLSTVIDYHSSKKRLSKNFGISSLRGKKFSELSENVQTNYYNYIFMVEQIHSDKDVDWGEVFQRVNKNQKTLKEQELRHARFDGWFINRAEKETFDQAIWKDIGVSSKSRNSRMKDTEFVSILMLVILEKKFVGFPQWKIDELYAKYDVSYDEIPVDDAEDSYSDDEYDPDFSEITQENINCFEAKFESVRELINQMESTNSCISYHKKRLFTDLYSLWCLLVFEEDIAKLGHEVLAKKYKDFIEKIDNLFVQGKQGEIDSSTPKSLQVYYANSTGAATEEEPRNKRHESMKEYFLGIHNEN